MKAKAIELVKEAMELDNAGSYEEALRKCVRPAFCCLSFQPRGRLNCWFSVSRARLLRGVEGIRLRWNTFRFA